MKRSLAIILILLLTVGALTGCGPNQEKIQEDFITILDQPASEETIKEAGNYLDKYLSKMDEEYANHMVHQYEHYILGFNLEGVNYDDWVAKYEKYITPELTEFYQIMAEEQNSPMAEDTTLKLSWEELLERTYKIEEFIKAHKDFDLVREDLIWIYGNYMNALVMGTNGTPIFDYKTHAFSESAKTVYVAFVNKYSDSTTSWALTEYFTYLDSIGYTMDYTDKLASKTFFDTCSWLVTESGKRVYQ